MVRVVVDCPSAETCPWMGGVVCARRLDIRLVWSEFFVLVVVLLKVVGLVEL